MARKYRKIDPRIWADERFAKLSNEEKLIALYCLTCQQCNRIGFFRFSLAAAADDLNTSTHTFGIRFRKVCDTLNWQFDDGAKVLYFPTWWKYNAPDNEKHMAGCLEDLHDLPATPLLSTFYANTKYLKPEPAKRIADVSAYVSPYVSPQEQEQEQEQEQDLFRGKKNGRFVPPTIEVVSAYCTERGNGINAQQFIDFYAARGWMSGKSKIKDWQACVRTWEKNRQPEQPIACQPLTAKEIADLGGSVE